MDFWNNVRPSFSTTGWTSVLSIKHTVARMETPRSTVWRSHPGLANAALAGWPGAGYSE